MTKTHIRSRYSVKKFDQSKKVSEENIDLLIEAFRYSPSSINIQAWKLIVVSNDKLKNKMALTGQQTNPARIRECSHVLVFCRKKVTAKHVQRVIDTSPYIAALVKKMGQNTVRFIKIFAILSGKHWAGRQLYLSFGFVMAACAANNIDSLPMEGFKKKKLKATLDLAKDLNPELMLALGYSAPDDRNHPDKTPKGRLDMDELVELRS